MIYRHVYRNKSNSSLYLTPSVAAQSLNIILSEWRSVLAVHPYYRVLSKTPGGVIDPVPPPSARVYEYKFSRSNGQRTV